MDITIIGWVWLGIVVGIILGFVVCAVQHTVRLAHSRSELVHQRFIRDSLKEEIIRLDNQPKPQPRKKRNIRAKSIKVGE